MWFSQRSPLLMRHNEFILMKVPAPKQAHLKYRDCFHALFVRFDFKIKAKQLHLKGHPAGHWVKCSVLDFDIKEANKENVKPFWMQLNLKMMHYIWIMIFRYSSKNWATCFNKIIHAPSEGCPVVALGCPHFGLGRHIKGSTHCDVLVHVTCKMASHITHLIQIWKIGTEIKLSI